MKILFCSPCALDRTLGAAQTLMDLADELEKRGWECDLVGPEQIDAQKADYPEKLYAYLKKHAHHYDIVDFDYTRFALPRRAFNAGTLFVARCQLLRHHFLNVQIPPAPVLRSRLRALLLGPYDRRHMQTLVRQNTATLNEADLVIVLNKRDEHELGRHGIPASNIRVIPNGMTEARHRAFDAVPVAPPEGAIIAFIGMYGPRKGAADFPDLVRRVTKAVPEARFRLLGTRGAYKTAEDVCALFPSSLQKYVEVIPSFAPEALPGLLAPCSVGVFPSYVEGFGLAVLEMLAAALPVVAYDAPGPPVMLPQEYLVAPGDTAAMSRTVVRLLQNREALAKARHRARQCAQPFTWKRVAHTLATTYEEALKQLRAGATQIDVAPHTHRPAL